MNGADLQQALEQALFDRLTAIVTLATVFQHVPDNTPPPVVIIGDMNAEEISGAKIGGIDRIEFDIISIIHGPGRKPLNTLQRQVRSALDQWRPADVVDVSFGEISFLDGNGLLIPDEVIYYGTQRFACLVQ